MRPLKVLSTVLVLSFLAAPAFAETARGEKPAAAAKAKNKGAKGAKREARMIAAMKKEGISEAKAKRVVAVVKKYRGEMRTVKQETKASREALKKNPNDTQAREAVAAARTKMKAIRDRQQKELATILTPAERAKIKQLIQRHHKGGKGKGGKKNKSA
jgi:hypothetical protein